MQFISGFLPTFNSKIFISYSPVGKKLVYMEALRFQYYIYCVLLRLNYVTTGIYDHPKTGISSFPSILVTYPQCQFCLVVHFG